MREPTVTEPMAQRGDALPGPTRAVGDVAWALRTLRRHGHAERRIVGDRGHLWRLAETPG